MIDCVLCVCCAVTTKDKIQNIQDKKEAIKYRERKKKKIRRTLESFSFTLLNDVYNQVEVSATGRLIVQRNAADCGVI
jgi:hypothetical protein